MLQHNIFTSQQQLDVSHFPSQWERKRLSLQMGTKKLPLAHMAGQQRWWESSSLPEQHRLSSEEPLKLDFSRAAEWWTASWSFTNKWWGNEKSSVAWLSSKTVSFSEVVLVKTFLSVGKHKQRRTSTTLLYVLKHGKHDECWNPKSTTQLRIFSA